MLPDSPRRVALLDELRGFFVLLMVLYHACYNLVEIFGLDLPFFYSWPMRFLQLVIAGDLILISGAVCRYSRNNLKRGAQVLGCGVLLTVVTAIALPSQIVLFGVLHLLGSAMMVFALTHKVLDKVHPTIGIFLMTALFLSTYFVSAGVLGFPPFAVALPRELYQTQWLFWLGLPGPGFYSSDYFSILPWLFFFLAGSYVGVYLRAERFPDWVYRPHAPWLSRVGKHALLIYLLHQPILYGVMTLLFSLTQR